MEVTARSSLLALVLCCNVTAAIIQQIVEEKKSVVLRCSQSVEGKLTWSRERDGHKTDILTIDGDRETRHIDDPHKRYSTLADKSLHILRVSLSDTGRYLCNNESAVDLILSGTIIHNATEGMNVTLSCPPDAGGSGVPTWSSDAGEIKPRGRFHVSTDGQTLTIIKLKLKDSGLYYCGGKPAAYLNVSKGDQSERGKNTTTPPPPTTTRSTPPPTTPTTTTTTTTTRATAEPTTPTLANMETTTTRKPGNPPLSLVFGIAAPCLLLLVIIIVIVYIKRCRFKKQVVFAQCEEGGHVYAEIRDGLQLRPTNGTSDLIDLTYSTISDLPTMAKMKNTMLPNESPYSCIGDTLMGEIIKV
uniref:hemicentin-1-like n=1 Tax=Semicossyphus pulcher TaxID=241346 RepID=UPI0037E93FDB